MNPYALLAIVVATVAALGGSYLKGRSDGGTVASARYERHIASQTAEAARKNTGIVKQDQELIVAKTVDKEKIQVIYRTIREQMDAEIIEVPIYRDRACSVPADGLRLIAAAAAGLLPANPDHPARDPAADAAGAQ